MIRDLGGKYSSSTEVSRVANIWSSLILILINLLPFDGTGI
jgi:hypothetical protein